MSKQPSGDTEARQSGSGSGRRIAFQVTDAVQEELSRIRDISDLTSDPEVFRRAFTLLRIHVDAARKNKEIYLVDPRNRDEKYIITLPFTVKRDPEVAQP